MHGLSRGNMVGRSRSLPWIRFLLFSAKHKRLYALKFVCGKNWKTHDEHGSLILKPR